MASSVNDNEWSTRAIMRLMVDVVRMEEFAARIRVQVTALAKEHGLVMPPSDGQTIA